MVSTNTTPSYITDLYHEFERQDMDTLTFYGEDIAVMVRLRERFSSNRAICDFAEYFIRLDQAEIENIVKEIENDRRQIQRFAGV